MTTEEKAKRFDEIVEEFRRLLEGVHEDSNIMKEDILKIIPELKTSDNERIRKALLNEFIHLQSKGYKFAGLKGEEIIDWLEKQWEQKLIIDDILTATDYDKMFQNCNGQKSVNKKELKKISSFCREHCKGYQETGRCFVDGECQAKKDAESAWNEEDENILEAIIYTIKHSSYSNCIGVSIEVMIDWLKSLKERMKI